MIFIVKKLLPLIVLLLLLPFLFLPTLRISKLTVFTGTVEYIDLEGGFYGIVDHNDRYDPLNLPVEFQIEGLHAFVVAKIASDQGSFHMWGTLIEILYILKF